MTDLARRLWARRPGLTPNMLLALIAAVALISVLALAGAARVNARQVEDRAATRATAESLCSLIALFLPQEGDAPSGTERGRVIVVRFRAEYDRLRCDQVLAGDVTPTPGPTR